MAIGTDVHGQQIKSHLRYRAVATKRKEDNPWQPLLEALKTKSDVHPTPRRLASWQLYMAKKPEGIDAVYQERWPEANLPSTRSLSFRAAIARELLAQESPEYREELDEEAVRLHEEELAELEASKLPQADPSDREAMHRCVSLLLCDTNVSANTSLPVQGARRVCSSCATAVAAVTRLYRHVLHAHCGRAAAVGHAGV